MTNIVYRGASSLRGHSSLACWDSSVLRFAWTQSTVDVSLHIVKRALSDRSSGQIYSCGGKPKEPQARHTSVSVLIQAVKRWPQPYPNPCKAIASHNRVVSCSGRVFKNTITWLWKLVGNKLVYFLGMSLNTR